MALNYQPPEAYRPHRSHGSLEDVRLGGGSAAVSVGTSGISPLPSVGGSLALGVGGMGVWDHQRLQARLRAATSDQPTNIGSPVSPGATLAPASRFQHQLQQQQQQQQQQQEQLHQGRLQLQPTAATDGVRFGSAASLLTSASMYDGSSEMRIGYVAEKKPLGSFEFELTAMGVARKFLFICLAVFAPPFWAMMRVGMDAQAGYWLGAEQIIATAVMLPLICVLSFVTLTARVKPIPSIMGVSLLVPSVLLLLVSNYVLQMAHSYANVLSASDCDTWTDMRELNIEWQAAESFYTSCMSTTANETGIPYEKVASTYVITDCGLYAETLKAHPRWAYLGAAEEQLYCAGWCRPGPALWTRQNPAAKDTCSTGVGQALSGSVQPLMTQVGVYAMVVLCATSLFFVAFEPLFAASRRMV